MQDISAFGMKVVLRASITFPAGITLTQFADDADPADSPALQIGDKAVNVNGELVTWSAANAIERTLHIIPGSDDDRNMEILFDANRPTKGKRIVRDVITLTHIYPDGRQVTFTNGKMMTGSPASGTDSKGKMKSKEYSFAFEGMNRS